MDEAESPIANLNRAALRCFKLLGVTDTSALSNLQYEADLCLKSLIRSRQNIPNKKEYSANSRTARKRKAPSNLLKDIAIELGDLGKAFSPGGRSRRRELSFEAVSALFGELPAGKHLIVSATRDKLSIDRDQIRTTHLAKMIRDGSCRVTFVAANFSNLTDQLEYLNSLRSKSGDDLHHALYTLKNDLPASFIELVTTKWKAAPNCNIAVEDIQSVLTQPDRLQFAEAAQLASLAVGMSVGAKTSLWDWKASAPVFELIRNVLDFSWPSEQGIPHPVQKKSDDISERTLLLDLLQAALDYVEARLAENLAEGKIQTSFAILGDTASTRNDLSILLGYILSLRFDVALLREYRAIIDDYVAFWDAATERQIRDLQYQESGSQQLIDLLALFEESFAFHSFAASRLSALQAQLQRLLAFGSIRPDITKQTYVGQIGAHLRIQFADRPARLRRRRGWTTVEIVEPDEKFLTQIVRFSTDGNERALRAWATMQAIHPTSQYLSVLDNMSSGKRLSG